MFWTRQIEDTGIKIIEILFQKYCEILDYFFSQQITYLAVQNTLWLVTALIHGPAY